MSATPQFFFKYVGFYICREKIFNYSTGRRRSSPIHSSSPATPQSTSPPPLLSNCHPLSFKNLKLVSHMAASVPRQSRGTPLRGISPRLPSPNAHRPRPPTELLLRRQLAPTTVTSPAPYPAPATTALACTHLSNSSPCPSPPTPLRCCPCGRRRPARRRTRRP